MLLAPGAVTILAIVVGLPNSHLWSRHPDWKPCPGLNAPEDDFAEVVLAVARGELDKGQVAMLSLAGVDLCENKSMAQGTCCFIYVSLNIHNIR